MADCSVARHFVSTLARLYIRLLCIRLVFPFSNVLDERLYVSLLFR